MTSRNIVTLKRDLYRKVRSASGALVCTVRVTIDGEVLVRKPHGRQWEVVWRPPGVWYEPGQVGLPFGKPTAEVFAESEAKRAVVGGAL
jgi:hypothetical protein